MKKLSKLLAALLILTLLVGSLCACASAQQPSTDNSTDTPAETGNETTTPETGDETQEPATEPVVLDWYIGGTPQEKQDAVFAAINKILVDELNIQVNFHFVDLNNYGQQMQMLMTSGQKIDMMYTSN